MFNTFKSQSKNYLKRFDNLIFNFFPSNEIGWKIDLKIALLAFTISLLLAFPSLWLYFRPDKAGRLLYQMIQAENPLNRDLPLTAQILSYRFFVPTLNYFFGLRGYGVVLIPIISSFLNLFLISRILRNRTKDILFSLTCVVGISLTWFIVEGTAFWATTDSVSHLLLLLPAAFQINPAYFIFALPCSLFVDERSIFACVFLWLFLLRRDQLEINSFDKIQNKLLHLKLSRKMLFFSISMLIGVIFWIIGRYIINSGVIAPVPDISVVTNQIPQFRKFFKVYWFVQILNHLSSFKWVYFYPLFLVIELMKTSSNNLIKKHGFNFKKFFGFHILFFVFYSSISMVNGDVWRSMSFAYFFVLDSVLILYNLNKKFSLKLSRFISSLMIITPVCFFGLQDLSPQVSFPLPLVLLRTYLGLGESFFPFLEGLFRYVPS